MGYLKMRWALSKLITELGFKRSDLYVVDADSSISAMISSFSENFPERYVNVGISEQDLIGVAAGIASCGKKVIVCTYSMFLMRAWEQVRNLLGRAKLDVKIVGTHSGISSYSDGPSHQCIEDIALMRVIPGMKVFVPADSIALRCCFEDIVDSEGPTYIRIGRDEDERVYSECSCRFGIANVIRDGSDVTIIAVGNMVAEALKAANELKRLGIDAAVIDLHTIKPIDKDAIIKYAMKTGAIVTAEEHNVHGGLGSAVAEVLINEYPVPTSFIGIKDVFGKSARNLSDLRRYLGLTSSDIVNAAKNVVSRK